MKWMSVLAIVCFGLSTGALIAADEKTESTGKGSKNTKIAPKDSDKTAKAKWAVVKIGEELKSVQQDKIKDLEASLAKDAKAAKESKDAKVRAKKVETKVTLVKGGFATEKDALKFIADEKAKAAKATKGHKDAGHPDGGGATKTSGGTK